MDGAQRLGEGLALEHGDTRSRSGAGDHTGQRGAFHHDQAENDNWRQGHEDRIDLEFRREYLLKRLDAACVKGSVRAAGEGESEDDRYHDDDEIRGDRRPHHRADMVEEVRT